MPRALSKSLRIHVTPVDSIVGSPHNDPHVATAHIERWAVYGCAGQLLPWTLILAKGVRALCHEVSAGE